MGQACSQKTLSKVPSQHWIPKFVLPEGSENDASKSHFMGVGHKPIHLLVHVLITSRTKARVLMNRFGYF